ncbi:MAG TPA: HK97 gp10 family phage protein, partial [Bryobacteraceae bacterium]|nr:HK97 gp10 family phage protein [Bryobacteraceae bacterium]
MKIDFQFDDPEELSAQLNDVLVERGAAIGRVPASALNRGVFEFLALVQDLAPKKTSTFVRSITALIEKISDDISEGRVGTPLAYARYLEEGTGVFGPKGQPITILPTNKKALFWGAFDGNGKALIRKRAVVQGMQARAPFATAIGQFIPRWEAIMREELAKGIA